MSADSTKSSASGCSGSRSNIRRIWYVVERSTGSRPDSKISARISAGLRKCPCGDPAAVEILGIKTLRE